MIELAKENKPWQDHVELTTSIKLRATELAEKTIFLKKQNYYFLEKTEKEKVDKAIVDRFINISYANLDDFKSDLHHLIILFWDNRAKLSICYCSQGFKYGMCHHKYALEITLGTCAKLVRLAPAKKRGRKRKTASALILQPGEEEPKPPRKKVKKSARNKMRQK